MKRIRKIKRTIKITGFLMVLFFTALIVNHRIDSEKLNIEELAAQGCPESLIELYEKNPETADFVSGYAENAGIHREIDVSGEIKEGEIPLFLQWDKRWGYETYGSNFMALNGCGPTSLSMVCCGLTQDETWNPYALAQKAEQEGYYVDGSGSSWNMMTDLAAEIGLVSHSVSFDEEHILGELESGRPIICVMGPGYFTTTGHFLVLTGVEKNGKIRIHDPNSKKNSDKAWDVETILSQTRNLWSYSLE